ncbi:MAG: hypothetical protein R6U38_06730 [Desulfatiglandaceae bacterium]
MDEVLDKNGEIARKVATLVQEIASASKEQAEGIEQINRAVSEMDKVTQQNAANAEESASASEQMNAQAEEVKAIVAALARLVGQTTTHQRGQDHTQETTATPAPGARKAMASPTGGKDRAGRTPSNRRYPPEQDSLDEF